MGQSPLPDCRSPQHNPRSPSHGKARRRRVRATRLSPNGSIALDCFQEWRLAFSGCFAMKPVTFRYKHDLDPKGRSQFGLIAEEVEKVNPDLVSRDAKGQAYTVRYEAVNAMLLNEFLKAHRKMEEQDKRIDQLTAQLKDQAALIQKVSDKVELNKPAPQIVTNGK